jgi:hypothetical protein
MEGVDGGAQQAEGFELADSREEASRSCGRAGLRDHGVEDSGDDICMGEGGLLGMAEGKGSKVAEVGVSGAGRPRADSSGQRVGRHGAMGSGTEGVTQEGEVVGRDGG